MSFDFIKAEGAGNDFIIIDAENLPAGMDLNKLVIEICKREKAIGADGVILYDKSETCDFKMRIFNPDGGEVEMCGNGARCVGLYAYTYKNNKRQMAMETLAGRIEIEITNGIPRLKLTDPKDTKLNFTISVDNQDIKISFTNTGVPHVVCLVDKVDVAPLEELGSKIRYNKEFSPAGTNVNFIEIVDEHNLKIRTYERGVEGENPGLRYGLRGFGCNCRNVG